MKKVKITVLKTTLDKDLAQEYGVEGLGARPMLKEGQDRTAFATKHWNPPMKSLISAMSRFDK